MTLAQQAKDTPTADALEALFVNNPEMARIEAYLGRFNPIRVMRMERMEVRHSAILAWLLDPMESHGLGDKVLKAFLGEAFRGQSGLGSPTALDVASADLRDAVVRREWLNIDIFIYSERNNWAFVVENKYGSCQHEDQLSKYLRRVHAGLGVDPEKLIVRGVFLTLYDEEPDDPSYAPINYAAICGILGRFIETDHQRMTAEARMFLGHYIEILAEEAGMSDQLRDMAKLAKQLWRDHRKVLNFIMENGSGSDFSIAAESLTGDDQDYLQPFKVGGDKFVFGYMSPTQFSFLPESWYDAFGGEKYDWRGCEYWWAAYPLITWLQLIPGAEGSSGRLVLYGEVGPLTQYEFRKNLIGAIQTAGETLAKKRIRFQKGAADEGRRYSKFLKENSVEIKDIQDAEQIAAGMTTLLKRFQPEFEAIGAVLSQFQEYGYNDD